MANSIQNKELNYNGGKINYEVRNSEGIKAPAVFIHGQLLNRKSWNSQEELINQLVEDGHPVLIYDRRGHGESDDPLDKEINDEYKYTDVEDMEELIGEVFGEREVFLIGHSSGGGIALDAAARRKVNIEGITLLDPSTGYYIRRKTELRELAQEGENTFVQERVSDHSQKREHKSEIQVRDDEWWEGIRKYWLESEPLKQLRDRNNSAYELVSEMLENNKGTVLKREGDIYRWQRDLWKDYTEDKGIKCPVRVIVGEEDKEGLENALRIHQEIEGSMGLIVEGAGHFANIERPREINNAIKLSLEGSEGNYYKNEEITEIIQEILEGREGQEDRTELDEDLGKEGEENQNFGINNK
ncbi:alpha/beta hydrolase [Patescibacteria group bacterium]|nr:alpha/beta hydrolase [Patescibacteria group bacterium]